MERKRQGFDQLSLWVRLRFWAVRVALLLSLSDNELCSAGGSPSSPAAAAAAASSGGSPSGVLARGQGAALLQRSPHSAAMREKLGRQSPEHPGSRIAPLPTLQPQPRAAPAGGAPQTWLPAGLVSPEWVIWKWEVWEGWGSPIPGTRQVATEHGL